MSRTSQLPQSMTWPSGAGAGTRTCAGSAQWTERQGRVTCRYRGEIVYDDSAEHWANAVCRLLGVTAVQARAWVERASEMSFQRAGRSLAAVDADTRACFLAEAASESLFPRQAATPDTLTDADLLAAVGEADGPCGHMANTVWQRGVGAHDELVVVGCSGCRHGWLAEVSGLGASPAKAIEYGQDYFEGNVHGLGYGDYLGQQAWRMEKSRRFLRQVAGMCQYAGIELGASGVALNTGGLMFVRRPNESLPSGSPRALDVGSGYGLFRKALDDAGWGHEGIEISRHACQTARSLFGFDTFGGTLEAFAVETANGRGSNRVGPPFDLITLWDVIEHVDDPLSMLRTAGDLLRPGGACALRTPNLLAAEHAIFGRNYHSLKREHLQYFSPRSVALLAGRAGLQASTIATQSTLLAGFSPADMCLSEVTQRGADIFALLTKGLA